VARAQSSPVPWSEHASAWDRGTARGGGSLSLGASTHCTSSRLRVAILAVGTTDWSHGWEGGQPSPAPPQHGPLGGAGSHGCGANTPTLLWLWGQHPHASPWTSNLDRRPRVDPRELMDSPKFPDSSVCARHPPPPRRRAAAPRRRAVSRPRYQSPNGGAGPSGMVALAHCLSTSRRELIGSCPSPLHRGVRVRV